MLINFTKMQGTGNDFVLINCLKEISFSKLLNISELCAKICHRKFGIGADQVLLLMPSKVADFRMDIYNADGSKVEMCGNGIRCLAKYIWDEKLSEKEQLEIETPAGIIKPKKNGDMVKVDMGKPLFEPSLIPVNLDTGSPIFDYHLPILDSEFKINCVSMGNPHAVIYLQQDISTFDVSRYGRLIENHSLFPKRINVEFVNVINKDKIKMRVWERGSGETLACGTGACSSAVVSIYKGLTNPKTEVELLGGSLFIEWNKGESVFMTGPAKEVFKGRINIDIF